MTLYSLRKNGLVLLLQTFVFCMFSCTSPTSSTERVQQLLSAAIAIEDSDVVSAIDLYEEAFCQLQDNPNPRFLRESHLRLGLLFMRNGLGEESVQELSAAYTMDSIASDTLAMSYSLRYLAFAYESMGRTSEARQALSRISDEYVLNETYGPLYRNIQADFYSRYVDLQEQQQKLPEEHGWMATHITPKSGEVGLALQGWQAESAGNDKGAAFWYDRLQQKHSPYMKAFAQLRLMGISLKNGDCQRAAHSLEDYQTTLNQLHQREAVSRVLLQHHARYQERRAQHVINQLSAENHYQRITLLLETIVAILTAGLLLLFIRNYRQRHVILRFRLDKMRQWREEYLNKSEQERNTKEAATVQTDIAHRLRQKLNGGDTTHITEEDWEELEKTVLAAYPNFRIRLFDLCRLSSHDYHVCLLLKMNMRPSDIARLTARSDEAITSTRRRLYERAFGQRGTPQQWDEVILSI